MTHGPVIYGIIPGVTAPHRNSPATDTTDITLCLTAKEIPLCCCTTTSSASITCASSSINGSHREREAEYETKQYRNSKQTTTTIIIMSLDPTTTTTPITNNTTAIPTTPDRIHDDDDVDDDDDDAILHTPVPLSREEADSVEVRKLARALAPTLVATEELFRVPADFYREDKEDDEEDDDDSILNEMNALGESESMLRRELELAQGFSRLYAFPSDGELQHGDDDTNNQLFHPAAHPETPQANNAPQNAFSTDHPADEPLHIDTNVTTPTSEQQNNTSIEADVNELDHQEVIDSHLPPIPIPPPKPTSPASPHQRQKDPSLFATPIRFGAPITPIYYTATQHAEYLQLIVSDSNNLYQGWHVMERTPYTQEFCLSVPDVKLRQWWVGFPRSSPTTTTAASPTASDELSDTEPEPVVEDLPVRTIAYQIRPDVLCGAVLDAVVSALTNDAAATTVIITKRQGGVCQATIPPAQYVDSGGEGSRKYPGYRFEARLVTRKSDCARLLVVRFFHLQSSSGAAAAMEPTRLTAPYAPVTRLRECAALVQRIEQQHAAATNNGQQPRRIHWNTMQTLTAQGVRDVVSAHLLDHYRPCPSVQAGSISLPALNVSDYAVLQSTQSMVDLVQEELDMRQVSFSRLQEQPFGVFPSLPTLDTHYCSQIRIVSRQSMTVDLVQSARDLEKFAREAELACANMIRLLQPTFAAYKVQAPQLPRAKPLTEYPLDYVLPQEQCPPWGDLVQAALNEIQAWQGTTTTTTAVEEHDATHRAVNLVFDAFQRQDDQEQSARLGRKNVQVMDRLAKMQAHQQTTLSTLEHCAAQSPVAKKAAESCKKKTDGAVSEVPLLKWSILVGNSTGTCTVTAHHILFVTQLIPILGGTTTKVFPLADVEFVVAEGGRTASSSLLGSFSTGSIRVMHKEQGLVYTFRPSMGAERLRSFLDVVKTTATQEPFHVD